MKTKLFKTLAATAMSVLAIACAKEPVADNGQQAGVSFMVEVPGASVTKAYGEAEKATKLYYQVFDNAGAPIEGLGVQTTDLVGKAAKVSFQLVKDQTYNFVFWAQTATEGYYTFGTDGLTQITANYTKADGTAQNANDENFDAFYAVKTLTITGPISETVTLKRPFAQINIGTKGTITAGTDSRDIVFTDATSAVTVTGVPTVFKPLANADAQLGTPATTVTFEAAAAPEGNITVNNEPYKYLAMNYVFASEAGAVTDITATLAVEGKNVSLSVPNAPIKRNWRTNILGSLLTSSVDINVVVDPVFGGNEDIDLVNIKNEASLKALFANGGTAKLASDFTVSEPIVLEGKKVVNLNLNGKTLTFNGGVDDEHCCMFRVHEGTLTIDGNGNINGGGDAHNQRVMFLAKGTDAHIVINNGNFKMGKTTSAASDWYDCVYASAGGRIDIHGGTFETEATRPNGKHYILNLNNGNPGTITVDGGKFVNCDPAQGDDHLGGNFVADGYKSTKVGDYYVVTKEDVTPVASNEGLNSAFNEAANAGKEITVNLSEGTFNWPDSKDGNNVKFPKTINVVGTSKEDCFVKFSAGSYPEDSDVIFENVTIDNAVGCAYNEGSLAQMVRVKDVTVKNCIIKNQFRILAKGIVNIKNCQFINTNSSGFDGYCLNYYGYDGSTVNVENCTFDTVQKAIVIYSEGYVANYTLNVKGCKFTASDSSTDKAAVQMHTECGIHGNVTINNCTATGFKANALSPEGLWWEGKNNVTPKVPTTNFTIKVDGTTVQKAE